MEKVTKAFFDLIAISSGRKETLDEPLSREEWFEVYEMAKKQTLLGPLSVALDVLDGDNRAPLAVYSRWMLAVEAIVKRNDAVVTASRKLYERFARDCFRSCVLKGTAIASFYPRPELRQSGDIDVWVEGGMEKVLSYLQSFLKVKDVYYHHCDIPSVDGIPVEVHFMPSWFNGFCRDRRLQKWFAANADAQFGNVDSKLGFAVPSPSFNAVFCLIHLLRHVLFEGVGLRQLMDYHYLLLSLSETERLEASEILMRFGLARFTSAVTYVLQQVFGLDPEHSLFPPDSVLGKALLDEVMIAGNFGKFDARNTTRKSDPFVKRGFGRIGRLSRYMKFCPLEVISAPAFKFWQYLWMKKYNCR